MAEAERRIKRGDLALTLLCPSGMMESPRLQGFRSPRGKPLPLPLGEMREYWLGVTPQAHLSKRRLLPCQ